MNKKYLVIGGALLIIVGLVGIGLTLAGAAMQSELASERPGLVVGELLVPTLIFMLPGSILLAIGFRRK